MRGYEIARVWGIPIRVNTSLLVFLPILAWLIGSGGQIEVYLSIIGGLSGVPLDPGPLRTGFTPWVIGIAAALGLFVGVTLHELGHSWVALRYGIGIESITLWILGGLAALESIPREWNREFWIAIAGPVTSVGVAAVCYAGLLVTPDSFPAVRFVVGWLAVTNLALALFNLLPAFPMDGVRILRALLARSRPYASATRIAGRIGIVFAFLFGIVGVLNFSIILLLLAWFVYSAATTESRTVLLDELLGGITVADIMTRDVDPVRADETVDALVERMFRERSTVFPVADRHGDLVGVVTMDEVRPVPAEERATTTVDEVTGEAPRIDGATDAFQALAVLGEMKSKYALVEDRGRVTGVLSEADYAHALTFQRGFRSGTVG